MECRARCARTAGISRVGGNGNLPTAVGPGWMHTIIAGLFSVMIFLPFMIDREPGPPRPAAAAAAATAPSEASVVGAEGNAQEGAAGAGGSGSNEDASRP